MHRILLRIAVIPAIFILAGCAAQTSYFRLDTSLNKDIKTISGADYIPLIRLCDIYELSWSWDSYAQRASVSKHGKSIVLRVSSDRILVDGAEKVLDKPVILDSGVVYVPIKFARSEIGYLVEEPPIEPPPEVLPGKFGIKTIVLDAGHGGKAVGAIGKRLHLREKVITLAIAKKLKGILEGKGIKVIMTRTSDTPVSLQKRADIANKSGADLFVSVHINASVSRKMSGFECYYLSSVMDDTARARDTAERVPFKSDEGVVSARGTRLSATLWDMAFTEYRRESDELAGSICKTVRKTGLMPTSKVKFARFYVLKHTRMPAVLVEMGYLSNWKEEKKFTDPKFIDKMTNALAEGILSYKKEYEHAEGFTRR